MNQSGLWDSAQLASLTIIGLPHNILFKILWLLIDFSLTFNPFPDTFGRLILAIFIHRQFKNFVQVFMLADLIFKKNLKL